MATDIERLVAVLEARTTSFEKAMNRAVGISNQRAGQIERRFGQMNSRLAAIGAGLGNKIFAGLAAGVSVRAFQQLSDAATRIDNALKVAGLSGEELEKVYERLRTSAIKNAAPIEAMVTLYSRLAQAQDALKINQEEMTNFTDKIGVALRVSGSSAEQASGALLQLSQALGAGIVRAEEYNSINEGARPILQAVAAGLKEAGGDVAKLRKLVIDGKVSSEAFFRAFEAGAPLLEQKVAGAQLTASQALGNLQTSLIDAAREFNNSTGASAAFAGGINNVAQAVSDFDISGFIQKIKDARNALQSFLTDVANSGAVESFAEFVTGLELTVGQPINLETVEAERALARLDREVAQLREHIETYKAMSVDTSGAEADLAKLIGQAAALRAVLASPTATGAPLGTPGNYNSLANRSINVPSNVNPVSLTKFPVDDEKTKKARKERENDYARETRQIIEQTTALVAETEARRGLNPLVDDYGFAAEKARTQRELLNGAEKAGLELTPRLRAEIAALAEQFAFATAEAGKLAESQEELKRRVEDMRDLGKTVMRGFIDDLVQGKSATEALAGALDKVGSKLLDIAMDGLFSGKSGGGGGILGTLFGGLFGGGFKANTTGGRFFMGLPGFANGTVSAPGGMALVGERGPEIVNLPRGAQVIPNHRLTKGGGGISAPVTVTIDARGADEAGLGRVAAQVARLKAELPATIVKTVQEAQKTRMLRW